MEEYVVSSVLFAIRILLPFIAIVIVYQCFSSMRSQRRGDRALIVLKNNLTNKYIPIIYWENSIGRSKNSDIVLKDDPTISRDHAVLFRRDTGWMISDTESKCGVLINGKKIKIPTQVFIDDVITVGGSTFTVEKTDKQIQRKKSWFFNSYKASKAIQPGSLLFLVTFFHFLIALSISVKTLKIEQFDKEPMILFGLLTLISWAFFGITKLALKRTTFELETLALFLSGTGILMIYSHDVAQTYIQLISMIAGIFLFCFMILFMKNVDRVAKFRLAIAIIAILLFAVNLVLAKEVNGSRNWIMLGPISLQLSEFIKIAFVFVGTSTLERLQTTKNLTGFILFSAICIGSLFLMKDFGTACIFFMTFLIISFMRSGSFRTVILASSAAAFGAFMILKFKPYVAERFSTWRHVWEKTQDKGYQQTQVLICAASGGLFGVGAGLGCIKNIFAGTSDLMFGLISEELGLIMAIVLVLSIASLALYTRTASSLSRSTFYSIAACAAAGMLVFQTSLHVFGITDVLPFTGVTLPFLSMGGSSMVSVWGLLAFIKTADERTYIVRK